MKTFVRPLFLLVMICGADGARDNPVQKVIQLLSELEAKLLKEGEAEEKAYKEFVDFCQDGAWEKQVEIKTAKAKKEDLEATIAKATATAEEASAQISDLAAAISTNEADLKAAGEIREKENADFVANEAELVDAVDTVGRAISILEKNAKGSALVQTAVDPAHLSALLATLNAAINTAEFSSQDKQKLMALMQNNHKDEDQDDDSDTQGAPDPEAYKSHSSNIIDILMDMKDKAEEELADARKAEVNSRHNYEMLKQSLEDELSYQKKEMTEAQTTKTEAEGTKAVASGDLVKTEKDLADAQAVLANMGSDCMSTATDHEASKAGRAAELKAIGDAKKIIQQSTEGAVSQTYSFLQVGSVKSVLRTRADLKNFEVVNLVKHLADQEHSMELAQLAARIAASMRSAAALGEDPFAKVKGLITEMIDRLMKEAQEEASHKAYCDEEMAKNKEKKEELNAEISKLTSKIDMAKARSTQLKEEVAELQKELVDLAKLQAEMDKAREDAHAAFLEAKTDLEQGITGVQNALEVLRSFYGNEEGAALAQQPAKPVFHEKASGAGGSIIGFLEVIESDFSKNLAEETTEEESAQTEYEKMTKDNKISKTLKEQDVKYKTQEAAALDKDLAENSSDREGLETELSALMEYGAKIRDMCIAKPETYEERKARREAEIAGLKEALEILEGQAVGGFIQTRKQGKKGLRGSHHLKL